MDQSSILFNVSDTVLSSIFAFEVYALDASDCKNKITSEDNFTKILIGQAFTLQQALQAKTHFPFGMDQVSACGRHDLPKRLLTSSMLCQVNSK